MVSFFLNALSFLSFGELWSCRTEKYVRDDCFMAEILIFFFSSSISWPTDKRNDMNEGQIKWRLFWTMFNSLFIRVFGLWEELFWVERFVGLIFLYVSKVATNVE